MPYTLLIFCGAGLGGIARYWLSNGIYWLFGRQFPYGTLVVNTTGCFLIGLLFALIVDRFADIAPQLRALLIIGFLGGYTTFSSFSIETINLFEMGAWINGTINVVANVALSITLTWLGILIGRQL